jgi:hypothetical protein
MWFSYISDTTIKSSYKKNQNYSPLEIHSPIQVNNQRRNYMLCMYICRLEIQSRKFLPKLNLNEITQKVIGFNDLKKILVEDQLSPTCTLLENTRNF